MCIDDKSFTTTIDRSLQFCARVPLQNKKVENIYKALEIFLHHYNVSGLYVDQIHEDR